MAWTAHKSLLIYNGTCLGSKGACTVGTRTWTHALGTVHILLEPASTTEHMLGTRVQRMVTRLPYAWMVVCVFPPAISMLYSRLREDVVCTYDSIHICHRYRAHPLGADEYDTAYAASGTMPSTYCTQTSQATDGCRCLRPTYAMLYPWLQEDIHCTYVQCISPSRQRV